MSKRYTSVVSFVVVVFAVLWSFDAGATHALGGDLSYECVSVDPVTGAGVYEVKIQFYRDCGGIPARTALELSYRSANGCAGGGTVMVPVNYVCTSGSGYVTKDQLPLICDVEKSNTTCNGGFLPGVEVYNYCTQITLPGNCDKWILSFRDDNRNAAISNLVDPDTYEIWVQDTINKADGPDGMPICNNSVSFTNPPARYFCAGICYNYNHGAVDIDGDSLGFKLVNPLGNNGLPIPMVAPAIVTQPIPNSNFTFDNRTGKITFCPPNVSSYVITVLVEEWRTIAGVRTLVGTTMRDMQFTIGPPFYCSAGNPTIPAVDTMTKGAQTDTAAFAVCLGDTLDADIFSTDFNGFDITLSSNDVGFIDGAVFNITGTGPTSTANLYWVPDSNDLGFHFFTVSSVSTGCPVPGFAMETFVIEVFESVEATADANVYCADSVQLNAVGTPPFIWYPAAGLSNTNIPNPKAAPAEPTWYVVQDRCGTDSVFIDVFQSNLTQTFDNCASTTVGSLIAAPTSGGGPYDFTWRDSTNAIIQSSSGVSTDTLENPSAGTYYLETQDASGCIAYDTITTSTSSIPNLVLSNVPDTLCPYEPPVQLNATPSGGTWSGSGILPNGPFDPSIANHGQDNTFTYTYTDPVTGCSNSIDSSIFVSTVIPINFSGLDDAYCEDDATVNLTLSLGSGMGSLSGVGVSGETFDPTVAGPGGPYVITYTYANPNGCESFYQDSVLVEAIPQPVIIPTDTTICEGQSVILSTSDDSYATYQWSNGETGQSITVNLPGTYSVTVTTSAGCIGESQEANVNVIAAPDIDVTPDTSILPGSSVPLNASVNGSGNIEYYWSAPQWLDCTNCNNPLASPESSITYTVQANVNGCIVSDSVTITILDGYVKIPNAFSPNGDGYNDEFLIFAGGADSVHLKIFNRWGEKVFDQKGLVDEVRWDGIYKGKPVNPNVFVYYVVVTFPEGPLQNFKGSLLVLR